MKKMLSDLHLDAPRPIAMALKSQIEVLNYVQSPAMTKMVIDNIMSYLSKALKAVEDKVHKVALQESFADLLQCLVFVMDACFRYEINQNKEESLKLFTTAGGLMVDSVSDIVKIAANGKELPKIENVLASN